MSRVTFQKTHSLLKRWAVPEIFGKGSLASAVRDQSRFAKKLVKTPLPALNPLFAFAFRTKYEKSPNLKTTRTTIELYDGGAVGIDRMELEDTSSNDFNTNTSKPIILMFPGGNENTYSTKVQTLCSSYLNAGYPDIYMCNYRGRCNTPFRTPQISMPYGKFNEVGAIVSYMNKTFKGRPIILTGDCFGGYCIVDYLTCAEVDDNVVGGVVHSVQWNADSADKKLMVEPYYSLYVKPWAKYTKNLLISGRKGNEEFTKQVYEKIGKERFAGLTSLSMEHPYDLIQLQRIGLNPLADGAFTDEIDFRNKTSPHKRIENSPLSKPLIVINADDDPTAPIDLDDIEVMEKDPNMCFWLFACGGHCSYVKHLFPATNFIDEVMVECSDILVKNFG